MKIRLPILFIFLLLITGTIASAQTTECNAFTIDLKKGTLNNVKATDVQDDIKKALPCFSAEAEETTTSHCGGGVFYRTEGFFFYTTNDFIEIRDQYKGTISQPIFGKSLQESIKLLGLGKPVRQQQEEGELRHVFLKTSYGCLRLKLSLGENKTVVEIGIHYQPADQVIICQ
jgi:hypothetical protein